MSHTTNTPAFIRHHDPDFVVARERDGFWESRSVPLEGEEKDKKLVYKWAYDRQEDTENRSWAYVPAHQKGIPHTVGLIVFSPEGDKIAAASPKAARRNDAGYIVTPPQLRMEQETLKKVDPNVNMFAYRSIQQSACVVACEFLSGIKISKRNDQVFFNATSDQARKPNQLVYVGSTQGNDNRDGKEVLLGKMFHWVAICLDREVDVFNTESDIYRKPQWVNTGRFAGMPSSLAISQRKFEMVDQALIKYGQITGVYNNLIAAATQRKMAVAA